MKKIYTVTGKVTYPIGEDVKNTSFTFSDEETGETMLVRYKGIKPDNFDEAYHVVAIGKYTGDAFTADKLLIKCPSKYEAEKGKVQV